jgi:hypothetical protein
MMHLILVPLTVATLTAQAIEGLPITVDPATERGMAGVYQSDLTLRFAPGFPGAIEVVRLIRSPGMAGWQVDEITHAVVRNGSAIMRGPAGAETLLLARVDGQAGYLLEGPFAWPAQPSARAVQEVWRRTLRGSAPGGGPLTWVGGIEEPPRDAWPRCAWQAGDAWECVGVPLGVPGVVIAGSGAPQVHALATGATMASGVEMTRPVAARWGRILVVGRTDRVPLTASDQVTANARRFVVPRNRPRSFRLNAIADDRLAVRRLAASVFWVGGHEAPDGTWIEIAATDRAPLRLGAADMAAAPADVPIRVDLEPSVTIRGRAIADDGTRAPGAVVTLWRELPPGSQAGGEDRTQRRVLVAETTSDAEGDFVFVGLADDSHEIVALHATFGRGESHLKAGDHDADVRLRRPSVAIGQVVRDGQPAEGVSVTVVPDLVAVAASDDLTQFVGGQSSSGADGRFRVAVPSRGSSEVRIGGPGEVRRVPLGDVESLPPVIDLGVIAMDETAIHIRLVLEASDECDLMLSGPVGRSGLSLVRSQRIGPSMFESAVPEPGRWLVSATCGARSRIVQPTTIDVTGPGPVTVPLVWK